ncbi:UNVERIFIED_CONTAM: hypothetical protein GTU68_046238 [Idotea baltica]|nr:hypothetical protein [Idotea baltica]
MSSAVLNATFSQPADRTTLYRHWGAHFVDGGVRFAVWAPDAQAVCVISDGNGWSRWQDCLHGSDNGVWSGVIPGVTAGTKYKYVIKTRDGRELEKTDPVGFATELRPGTASIVTDLRGLEWTDQAWLEQRAKTDWLAAPVSCYEVHPGSWRKPTDGREFLNYRELAHQLADYVLEMGYTHVQLMPITEHPFDGSWGYQTTGYFAPSSRFGGPDDFRYFVDYMHSKGLGVLLDWVPGHFPTDACGLGGFDGTCMYEHADPRQGYHPDWNTLIFNYGRREVSEFLLSSARFWCDVYHIDGLRVDAVASMLYVPNQYGGRENLEAIEFLKDFNVTMHAEFPGVLTIAEESTAWPGVSRPTYDGGLGFTMKWDMGWMNDTLRFMQRDPIHRGWHLNDLTFRNIYAFTENFMLPLSHDEVVHGKGSLLDQMTGDEWQKFANLRLLYGMQYAMPGKNLLFMGCEFGQWKEWNHDGELDWVLRTFERHEGIRRLLCDLNRLYSNQEALHTSDTTSDGFRWVVGDDQTNSVLAFIRQTVDATKQILVVCNLTPNPQDAYRIGVPAAGFYKEILNTDGDWYGGSGLGNVGGVYSTPVESHGEAHSVQLQIPPLSVTMLECVAGKINPKTVEATAKLSQAKVTPTPAAKPKAATKPESAPKKNEK